MFGGGDPCACEQVGRNDEIFDGGDVVDRPEIIDGRMGEVCR